MSRNWPHRNVWARHLARRWRVIIRITLRVRRMVGYLRRRMGRRMGRWRCSGHIRGRRGRGRDRRRVILMLLSIIRNNFTRQQALSVRHSTIKKHNRLFINHLNHSPSPNKTTSSARISTPAHPLFNASNRHNQSMMILTCYPHKRFRCHSCRHVVWWGRL